MVHFPISFESDPVGSGFAAFVSPVGCDENFSNLGVHCNVKVSPSSDWPEERLGGATSRAPSNGALVCNYRLILVLLEFPDS